MASKKYVNDYKIELDYNPLTKRQKMTAHYVGPRYSFSDRENIGRSRVLYTAMVLLSAAAYLPMLFVNAPCMHIWYVAAGIVLLMLPMFLLTAFLYRLLTAGKRVTREHRDKISDRVITASVGNMILSGLSLTGHIIYSFLHRDTAKDVLFYLLTSVILLLAVLLFRFRHLLALEMTEEGQTEADDNKIPKEED